ncbi:hypothetical protein [uncultured Psychroserpens sp.]|uniref:hypothetical protein n=1 Tax=uncultured Psychroserpens sp. TaxID=255436 RepID=UPI002608AEDC|nr:hypothetical protein [uncultured Psychroserpens sp.]
MRYILYLFLAISVLSCKNENSLKDNLEIDKIKVYYFPFDITPPVGLSEEGMRDSESISITKIKNIQEVKMELLNLEKLKNPYQFSDTSIHLLCDFYYKDKLMFTLLHDTNYFVIEDNIYENNKVLIELLIEDFKLD